MSNPEMLLITSEEAIENSELPNRATASSRTGYLMLDFVIVCKGAATRARFRE
jgi:hypothetical protein